MPPKSNEKKAGWKIPVQGGRAHWRTIQLGGRQIEEAITDKMTRKRLEAMPYAMQMKWKEEALQKILEFSPVKSDQESIRTFLNSEQVESGVAVPSSDALPARERQPPLSPAKKSKKNSPTTPEGVTPSKRDGKNAALLDACSPYAWS